MPGSPGVGLRFASEPRNLDSEIADSPWSPAEDWASRVSRSSPRLRVRSARLLVLSLFGLLSLTGTHQALAQEAEAPKTSADALPGSPRPPGPGLSPQAPPTPPAPGGRAPSFGAPTDPDVWSFRFGGKISGYQSVGIGERALPTLEGQSDTPLHTPPRTDGKRPFDSAAALTLNLSYGNAVVGAFVNYTVNSTGKEREGQYQATKGAAANSAYIMITPQALGNFRLQAKVGAVSDSYAGTGQWGWGILGPLVAVRGYGETLTGEYDVSSDLRLFFSHGVLAVPGVPEFFVRGNHVGWNETAVSTVAQHAHVGLSYKGKYNLKLHAVNAAGTDERTSLAPPDPTELAQRFDGTQLPPNVCDFGTPTQELGTEAETGQILYRCPRPRDGRIDVFALETHTFLDQWGHVGVAGAYYNMITAGSVHDGIWWGLDWTQGAREMTDKYLGKNSGGTGQILAISAQYDFSLASVLWHPEPFDGRGADLRVGIAGLYHWTVDSAEDIADDAQGYQVGLDVEYRMLPWLSSTFRVYGTGRDGYAVLQSDQNQGQIVSFTGEAFGHSRTFTMTPGLIFRSDWQAPERIEIAYTRHIYNDFVDNNPARPLDTDVVTIGGVISF